MQQGGCGVGGFTLRSAAAWTGAWESGIKDVAEQLGINRLQAFTAMWPSWKQTADANGAALARQL